VIFPQLSTRSLRTQRCWPSDDAASVRPGALYLAPMIEAAPKTEEIPAVDAYARGTEAGRS
jgi:hypothetical protein